MCYTTVEMGKDDLVEARKASRDADKAALAFLERYPESDVVILITTHSTRHGELLCKRYSKDDLPLSAPVNKVGIPTVDARRFLTPPSVYAAYDSQCPESAQSPRLSQESTFARRPCVWLFRLS